MVSSGVPSEVITWSTKTRQDTEIEVRRFSFRSDNQVLPEPDLVHLPSPFW